MFFDSLSIKMGKVMFMEKFLAYSSKLLLLMIAMAVLPVTIICFGLVFYHLVISRDGNGVMSIKDRFLVWISDEDPDVLFIWMVIPPINMFLLVWWIVYSLNLKKGGKKS
jgi:hypothetical protein